MVPIRAGHPRLVARVLDAAAFRSFVARPSPGSAHESSHACKGDADRLHAWQEQGNLEVRCAVRED
eukprot:11474949-Alexandrium_andersonii.AAC.1